MFKTKLVNSDIHVLIKDGRKLPFATENYPSRGQTAVQELYQTQEGKFFLKRVSERNHTECQIDVESGTLAEREFWAYKLAEAIGLNVPPLWLMDKFTTVQRWLDYPDGKTFKRSTGKMEFTVENIFDCAVFDWITGQIDRHDANYLYNYKDRLIIPVDSAHAFLKYEGALPDYLHLCEIGNSNDLKVKINSGVKRKLDNLSNSDVVILAPLKDMNERDALISRKNALEGICKIQDLLDLYRSKK